MENMVGNKMGNKKTGIITVFAAIVIQLCLGMAYVWSVFQNGIAESVFSGDNAGVGAGLFPPFG